MNQSVCAAANTVATTQSIELAESCQNYRTFLLFCYIHQSKVLIGWSDINEMKCEDKFYILLRTSTGENSDP